MNKRQEAVFNVLNEWLDLDQYTFLQMWPELKKTIKPPKSEKYAFVVKELDKQIGKLMDERDASLRLGMVNRADNIYDQILDLNGVRGDMHVKYQEAREKEDPRG